MLLTTEVNAQTIQKSSGIKRSASLHYRSKYGRLHLNNDPGPLLDEGETYYYDASSSLQRRADSGEGAGVRSATGGGFRPSAHMQHPGGPDGTDRGGCPGSGPHGPDRGDHLRGVERHETHHEPVANRSVGEFDFHGTGFPGDGAWRSRHPAQNPADRTAGEMPAKSAGRRALV